MIWWSSWRQNHLQYINSPYLLMIAALFCRLSDVSGRLFRNRSGCFADGNPISGDGKRWYQSWRSCCHLCLPGGDYSRTDFRGCGAGGASFEMSLIDFAFKTTLPISIAAIIGMAIAHFFWQRYLDKRAHLS